MSHSIRLHSVCYCTVVKQITDADENDICSVEVENVGPTLGGVYHCPTTINAYQSLNAKYYMTL